MEVTTLCIRLLMNVLTVLVTQGHNSYCAQKDGAASPRILENRLQFFEYESISFNCDFDGSAEWRMMRACREISQTDTSNWVTSAGSGTIKPAFSSDSGEYWCEDGDGQRSSSVNITVTAGSVILESPVLPVMEGDNVTLHCQKKKSPADLIADFYKDGIRISTSYKGIMMIYNVSTSDDGLYKCNISGAGESPESQLSVRVFSDIHEEETRLPPTHSPDPHTLPWTVLWTTSLLLALLLLVTGVVCCMKSRGKEDKTEGSTTRATRGDDVADPCHATYAVVKKPRKKKGRGSDDLVDPHNVMYASVKMKEKEPKVSKTNTKPCLPEESVVYASVNFSEDR